MGYGQQWLDIPGTAALLARRTTLLRQAGIIDCYPYMTGGQGDRARLWIALYRVWLSWHTQRIRQIATGVQVIALKIVFHSVLAHEWMQEIPRHAIVL